MTETKKILLIGRSGRGKSTLANVLLNKNNNFEEVFKESSGSVSETKKIQFEEFNFDPEKEKLRKLEEKIASEQSNLDEEDRQIFQKMLRVYLQNKDIERYCIIDTPGIGDTKMSDNQVLDIIAEAVYLAKDGLSQVLFVVGSRFDQSEMATYNLLRTIIFDDDITKHTTVVRTRFADFRSEKKRQTDIELMVKESQEKKDELKKKIVDNEKEMEGLSYESEEYKKIASETEQLNKELKSTLSEIIESCQGRIVHVDNKPDVKIRGKSRTKLLDHLGKSCQTDYKPEKLKELSNAITEDMDKLLQSRKELEEEMKKLKTSQPSFIDIQSSEIKDNIDKLENSKTSSVTEKEKDQRKDNQGFAEKEDSLAIGEKIIQLEGKRERLKKEIKEKEKVIRQKVLKHIFNSYEEISSELGGNVLMESVIGEHKWENISPKFKDKKLVLKWLNEKFDYEQVQKWATVLGNGFEPKNDAGFCAWLRDDKKLTVENIKELIHVFDVGQLKHEYFSKLEKVTEILNKHNQQLSWEKEKNPVQEWLDQNYPKKKRGNVKELNISNQNLEGKLDLRDFVNLERLDCQANSLTGLNLSRCTELRVFEGGYNQLTNLDFTGLVKLEKISFNDNYLTDFDYSLLNPNKLIHLNVSDNNLQEQDLSVFSQFVNLEFLWIGNGNQEQAMKDIRNRFCGSFKSLKNLTKLSSLFAVSATADSNLECLPSSIKDFRISSDWRPLTMSRVKVKTIEQELKKYGEPELKEYFDGVLQLVDRNFSSLLLALKQSYQEKQEFVQQTEWLQNEKK